jgi:uncharacterized protein (UPF0333 family)
MIINKKSQAAMEFLMTYGWALLVVLIVIAALAFFGLLNPSRFLPEKCEIAPGVTCMDFNAQTSQAVSTGTATDLITILLNNGLGQTMYNVKVNVSNCLSQNATNTTTTLPSGSTHNFEMKCAGMVANSRFKSDLIVNYDVRVEGHTLNHTKNGYMVVEVERN